MQPRGSSNRTDEPRLRRGPDTVSWDARLRRAVALIDLAEIRLGAIRRDQRRSVEVNPESDSIGVLVRTAEGDLEAPAPGRIS